MAYYFVDKTKENRARAVVIGSPNVSDSDKNALQMAKESGVAGEDLVKAVYIALGGAIQEVPDPVAAVPPTTPMAKKQKKVAKKGKRGK